MGFNSKKIQNSCVLAMFLLILAACSQPKMKHSQDLDAEIKADIRWVFMDLVKAVKSLNVDSYLKFFDQEKFTSMNADGSVHHSLIAFEKPFREQSQFIQGYESLEFENIKITVVNITTAILVNEYQARVNLKSGDTVVVSGAGTQVWSKSTGQWKLVHVSSSAKK